MIPIYFHINLVQNLQIYPQIVFSSTDSKNQRKLSFFQYLFLPLYFLRTPLTSDLNPNPRPAHKMFPHFIVTHTPLCKSLQQFQMSLLKQHQIKQHELKLLETDGHSLADYTESRKSHQSSIHIQKRLIFSELKNLEAKWANCAGKDASSSLKAFVCILLHRIYSEKVEQNLLSLVKSTLYRPQVELSGLAGSPTAGLSSNQMKKLLVQFFYLLQYSFFDDKVEAKLNKYPIILHIFILFLSKLLPTKLIGTNPESQQKINTFEVYTYLCQLFGIRLEDQGNLFRFPENQMFIMQKSSSQYIFGRYIDHKMESDNKIQSYQPSNSSVLQKQKTAKITKELSVHMKTNSQEDVDGGDKKKTFFMNLSNKTRKTMETLSPNFGNNVSLKNYRKNSQNSLQTITVTKVPSSFDLKNLTEHEASDCGCVVSKKKSNLKLESNLYEINVNAVKRVQAIRKQSGLSETSIMYTEEPKFYISSKGISCELFQSKVKKNNKYTKSPLCWKDLQKAANKNFKQTVKDKTQYKCQSETSIKLEQRPLSSLSQNCTNNRPAFPLYRPNFPSSSNPIPSAPRSPPLGYYKTFKTSPSNL